ncbi:MAG: zinc-binding dehydrogenase [Phycisphaeraceae bacterium]|nr:zinc-binding dehydrogenase [Phycisphaeraceae bacterium]
MKTLSAVLVELNKPLELWELEIPALAAGQVLVEVAFSGVCHTQVLEARGRRGQDRFLPHNLGHEGSGVVREVGPGVRKVKVGERVVLSWLKGSGADVPGVTYRCEGKVVNAGAVTTFNRLAVVSENRLTVLPAGLDMRLAMLLGCALPTGLGSVMNTAVARPGESCAVIGCGGVGLCAVMGAAVSGCHPLIAVDLIDAKLEVAKALGATATINAGRQDVAAGLAELCPGGLDVAIEVTGRPEAMRTALEAVRQRGGRAVIVGNAPFGSEVAIDPKQFNQGKRLLGTWGGDSDPDRDFPRFARLLADGRLKAEVLLGQSYALSQVNAALDDLEAGRVVRPVIDMAMAG